MMVHLPPTSKAEAKALLGIVFHYLSWWWVWGVLCVCMCIWLLCFFFFLISFCPKTKGKASFIQSAVFKEWETIQCCYC